MEKIATKNSHPRAPSLTSADEDEEELDEEALYDDFDEEWDPEEMDFFEGESEEIEEEDELEEEEYDCAQSLPISLKDARSVNSFTDEPMQKYPFKLKNNEAGNVLTVHHMMKNMGREQRVRIATSCFNENGSKLLVIDRRGNIFVFDFVKKCYWRLSFRLAHATLMHKVPDPNNYYIVGNEKGQVFMIDLEKSIVSRRNDAMGKTQIDQISWGNRLQSSRACNALMRYGAEAVLFNLVTLQVAFRLEFDQSKFALKLAGFIPNSDQFFTCFTNDVIHIWSTQTLKTVRIVQPIKSRDRKLRLLGANKTIPEFALRSTDEEDSSVEDELASNCEDHTFADGQVISYSFTPNGNKLCLTTLDGYLLMLSSASFDLDKLYKMRDFILKQVVLLPQPKERYLIGITVRGLAVMLDLENTDHKLIVQRSQAVSMSVSQDGKMLSVLSKCGEVNVWLTCRLSKVLDAPKHCITQVQTAVSRPKARVVVSGDCMNRELRNLLKRERLEAILNEYGRYPEKYRFVIWSRLLELPSNGKQYQELLKLGQPGIVKREITGLKIKNDEHRRAVIKAWSCLAHWCKVFGYAKFMPHLVFPFAKHLPKNGMVVFELLATILVNHLQLCFEFHPLPPDNYLAMCENVLQINDDHLSKFYQALDVKPKDYAWSMVTNAFAEVLDEKQWLVLWDNILTEPPYFIIFVIVAYNLLQREVLLRLPDKAAVLLFFHEQNPIDETKLVCRARKIMKKCPSNVHPKRFIPQLAPIPKGVYPKFLNYPSQWIDEQEEQTAVLLKQQQEIDARIRHLELEELKMKERLENGLKQEEHARRVKEMEKVYQDTIQREDERIACHSKMLLSYQLEVRQLKSEVMTQLQESEQRRQVLEMEKDMGMLMHNIERERRRHNQQMLFAEDEIRNQEMELLAQRYYADTAGSPLAQKYYDNIQNMCQERDKLQNNLRQMTHESMDIPKPRASRGGGGSSVVVEEIERSLLEIQREFSEIMNSDSNNNDKENTQCSEQSWHQVFKR